MLVKGHGQGHKVIDLDSIWKSLIIWVYMPNRKSLSHTVQKLWPRMKCFATESQTDWITDGQDKNYMPRIPFPGIKSSISILYPFITLRMNTHVYLVFMPHSCKVVAQFATKI